MIKKKVKISRSHDHLMIEVTCKDKEAGLFEGIGSSIMVNQNNKVIVKSHKSIPIVLEVGSTITISLSKKKHKVKISIIKSMEI